MYAELSHSTDGPAPPPPAEQETVKYATVADTKKDPSVVPYTIKVL